MGIIRKALCAAAFVGMAMTSMQASAEAVKLGNMTWPETQAVGLVSIKTLEQAGVDVEVTEFSNWGIAFAALRKGDIDGLMVQLDYVAQPYWEKNKKRMDKVAVVSHGLYQDFAVPKYVDIDSIEELNANADLFGNKIVGIEEGTGLMREAEEAMTAYGLSDLKLIGGSTPAMTASLKSAVDRKEPIVVTLWDPTWMFLKYDMKFLDDPKSIFAPPQSYNWIGVRGFAEKFPITQQVLAGVFVPIDVIRDVQVAVENGDTVEGAVDKWMAANTDLVSRWRNIGID